MKKFALFLGLGLIATTLAGCSGGNQLAFELSEDRSSYSVRAASKNIVGEVEIPAEHNGLPVKAIANEGFSNRQNISKITIPEGIEYIGDIAFFGCSGIKEISLPKSLSNIGEMAFVDSGIEEINVNEENAYYSSLDNILYTKDQTRIVYVNSNIEEVTLSSKVEILDNGLFAENKNLKSVTLPDSLFYVSEDAFNNCSNLETVNFGKGILSIGESAFEGCVKLREANLPESVIEIGTNAFKNCLLLETLTLGDNIKSIGEEAFAGCGLLDYKLDIVNEYVGYYYPCGSNDYSILIKVDYNDEDIEPTTEFSVHEGCQFVLGDAFTEVLDLKKLTLPNSIKYFGVADFLDFEDLKYYEAVTNGYTACYLGNEVNKRLVLVSVSEDESFIDPLPETFKIDDATVAILPYAFEDFPELLFVTDSNPVFYASDGVLYNMEKGEVVFVPTEVKDVVVPYGVYDLGESFKGLRYLERIALPEGIQYLVDEAFMGCSKLKEIILSSTLLSIGDSAFEGCVSLEAIDLPLGLVEIGMKAFASDILLKSVVVPSTVTLIGGGAFSGCKGIEEIVLPFIGGEANADKFISYIFGAPKVSNGESSIPESLKKVTLLMGDYYVVNHNAFYCHKPIEVVVLPLNIVAIGDHAFYGCENLKEINLSEGLTAIGDWAFFNCKELEEITLPSTLKYIGRFAFRDCVKLETIYFAGTKAQYQAIEKGGSWNAGVKASVVVCSDGEIGI